MNKRVSKFELLRIIAMYLIVVHHSIIHGMLNVSEKAYLLNHPVNLSASVIMELGGKIGVIIFVLITGYFMVYSQISLTKILRIWLPIFFWSIFFYFLYCVSTRSFSIFRFIKAVFPLLFNEYWFMTVYLFLYLLIPFLNEIIKKASSRKLRIYLLILGTIIVLSGFKGIFGGPTQIGSMLLIFCYIYYLGALMRIYDIFSYKNVINKIKFSTIIVFLLYSLIIITLIIVGSNVRNLKFYILAQKLAVSIHGLILIFIAFGIFVWIGSTNIGYHKSINKVASLTFGIYIVSDNYYVRSLWNNFFHMNKIISGTLLYVIFYILIVSMTVFMLSAILEYIRQVIFSNFEKKLINELNKKIKFGEIK